MFVFICEVIWYIRETFASVHYQIMYMYFLVKIISSSYKNELNR